MAKYDPLRDDLARRPTGTVRLTLTFGEIEALVGPLPPSARVHRTWWGNDAKVEALAWRAAGWRVESVNQTTERVVFVRDPTGPPAPTRTPASPAPPGPAGVAATADEAAVQAHLVAYLVGEGWQIVRVADTATRERGIDILARRDGRTLAVEVKGYPGTAYADPRRAGEVKPTQPSTQARHWYAQAVLKAMLTREEQPGYDLALGFPEATTYRRLHRGTRGSLDRLGVTVLFVAADGSVVEG